MPRIINIIMPHYEMSTLYFKKLDKICVFAFHNVKFLLER